MCQGEPVAMSESSSEDEYNLEALKEAVAQDFLPNSIYNTKTETIKHSINQNKPTEKSLRSNTENYEDQFNELGVTIEFQKHVAKHLVKLLDEKLKTKIKNRCSKHEENSKKRKIKGGVKLFHASKKYLRIHKEKSDLNRIPLQTNENFSAKECENDILEKAKSVSVEPDYILSKKEILCWSNRSKAPVFRYKRKNGKLYLSD